MSNRVKYFALGAASVYMAVAIMSGVAMSRAIPALNALGSVYVGATWPVSMFCVATQIDCIRFPEPGSPLANAFFTFKEPKP